MADFQNLVEGLFNKDDKQAYSCLEQLQEHSAHSSDIYAYFDTFADMLDSDNSFIRTRGIVLIAANAQWDIDYKVDDVIDRYLKHITDDKPITARQCIKSLLTIAQYKPDLRESILDALHHANFLRYKDSMRSLVIKDSQAAMSAIRKM